MSLFTETGNLSWSVTLVSVEAKGSAGCSLYGLQMSKVQRIAVKVLQLHSHDLSLNALSKMYKILMIEQQKPKNVCLKNDINDK